MYDNKDNGFNKNADTTQNEQEQFADGTSEESGCRFPEKIQNDVMKNEESVYAFRWEETTSEKYKNAKVKKSGLFIQTLIMSISFVLAFGILSYTLIKERRMSGVLQTAPEESTKAPTEDEGGKTIYIKEYDAESGILTPQQIYSYSLPSVVSIKASNDIAESIGSGFVFDGAGYIATAHHVVDKMTKIKVITADNEEFDATVVASDDLTDLALLKIDCSTLPSLAFGKSSDLLVGDRLFAIGTPASLEFAGTMSSGDVSFTDRTVSIYNESDGTLKKKMTLIQTTAALNRGNSGGPVLDEYGKLVGIVTMKLGDSFDGISFIIPSDGAYTILCNMRDGIALGDNALSAVATYAAKMGVIGENYAEGGRLGIRIVDFAKDECDAAKKMRTGDVIVSIDGEAVSNVRELSDAINSHIPGDTVAVTVYRSEQLLTFSIILGR